MINGQQEDEQQEDEQQEEEQQEEQQEDDQMTQDTITTAATSSSQGEDTYLTLSEPSLIIDTDWSSLTDTDQPGADYNADNDERGVQGTTKRKQPKKRERRSESDNTIKETRKERSRNGIRNLKNIP